MKLVQKHLPLLCILIIATVFRFYRFTAFQYWSPDEEILAAVALPMALGQKLLLISPNATLAISLGPFFHWLTALIYFLARFDPVKILAAGSILGVITAILISRISKVGAFLYAGSFVASLFDRRWWPLSLDPLLITSAILSLGFLARKKYWAIVPLAIAICFGFHADPSLAIIVPAAIFVFWKLKVPLLRKEYLMGLATVAIFVLPIIFFEVRHPGAITSPVAQMLTKQKAPSTAAAISPVDFIGYLSRGFFPMVTVKAEEYVATYRATDKLFPNPILVILTLALVLWPILKIRTETKTRKTVLVILYSFLTAFLIGLTLFGVVTKYAVYQQYFVVIWPVAFLLAGFTLESWWQGKLKLLALLSLGIFVFTNVQTLVLSKMTTPLAEKVTMVDTVLTKIDSKPFSLMISKEEDTYLGGLGGIFYLRGRYPNNLSYYRNWDWVYKSYSLYGPGLGLAPKEDVLITPRQVIIKDIL